MNLDHVLTLLIVIPLAGLIPLLFFIRDDRAVKQVAIVTTFAELVLSIVMLSQFHIGEAGFQLHEKIPWIPGLGVSYELGVDGLSVLLVPMTTLLTFISVLYSSGGAIKTRVEDGWVTLEGEVEWQFQREAAVRAIRNLAGVKDVSNLITLRAHSSTADVTSRIKAALHRSAEKGAQTVQVETHDGTVTLRGAVQSWGQRRDVERAAWAATGVTRVDDFTTVMI